MTAGGPDAFPCHRSIYSEKQPMARASFRICKGHALYHASTKSTKNKIEEDSFKKLALAYNDAEQLLDRCTE